MNKKETKKGGRPPIDNKVKIQLWSRSAGRCQFEGCNTLLNSDILLKTDSNSAYIAHIYGYAPGSARYNKELSPKLEKDLSNLMLLCDVCHRRIDDTVDWRKYPADLLISMKRKHEERVELVTSIAHNKRTTIVLFGARIGEHKIGLNYGELINFVIPEFYPSSKYPIELGFYNNPQEDKDLVYWETQKNILKDNYKEKVLPVLENASHISLFALAPIPLLIYLGTLLGDKTAVRVHQRIRETNNWNLSDGNYDFQYKIIKPLSKKHNVVALNISLSAVIENSRISEVLGTNCDIYSISIDTPFNDFLRDKFQLDLFTKEIRILFDEIKEKYGQKSLLHVFPAMPLATAVEMGRHWMPKADLKMVIYDQNNKRNGFVETIKIGDYAN